MARRSVAWRGVAQVGRLQYLLTLYRKYGGLRTPTDMHFLGWHSVQYVRYDCDCMYSMTQYGRIAQGASAGRPYQMARFVQR